MWLESKQENRNVGFSKQRKLFIPVMEKQGVKRGEWGNPGLDKRRGAIKLQDERSMENTTS